MPYSAPSDPYDLLVLGGAWPAWMGLGVTPVVSNIAAYWPLDDPVGGTVLNQSGGAQAASFREASGLYLSDTNLWGLIGVNGAHVTAGTASLLTSGTSTCVHHDATSTSIQAAWAGLTTAQKAAAAPTGQMSFVCWANFDDLLGSSGNGNGFFYGQFGGYSPQNAYQTFQVNGLSSPTARLVVPSATMMFVHTFDGAHSVMYVNGVQQGSTATAGPISQGTAAIELLSHIAAGSPHGSVQKISMHSSALTAAQVQGLYMMGARSVNETGGTSVNVYPFSRQVTAAGAWSTIALTNDSDTPIYLSLGSTAASPGAGVRVNANGGSWSSSVWKGAIQAIHDAPLGGKPLLIQTT